MDKNNYRYYPNFNDNNTNNNLNFKNNINSTQSQVISKDKKFFSNTLDNNNTLFQTTVLQSRKKYNLKLTNEESIIYNNCYSLLDNKNTGKINGKEAGDFMKKSNLQKSILRRIWLIAAQTDDHFLLKNEFFVACRLIALAQNNLPYTEKNIETNNPIPPLPKFDIKNLQNQSKNEIFEIPENEKLFFKKIFDEKKENNTEKIRARNAIVIWKNNNTDDNAIKMVAKLLNPLENKGFFNIKEFQVACHLIKISKNISLPEKLPDTLLQYLGRINSFNNSNVSSTNNNPFLRADSNNTYGTYFSKIINRTSSNNNLPNDENIQKTLKRAEELNQKNENLNQQINNAKNKINVLLKEIDSLENEQEKIKNELNSIIQECINLRNNNIPKSNNDDNNMANNLNIYSNNQNLSKKLEQLDVNVNNNLINNNNLQNKKTEENINSKLERVSDEISNQDAGKIEEIGNDLDINLDSNHEDNKTGTNNDFKNINNMNNNITNENNMNDNNNKENNMNNDIRNDEKKEDLNIRESGMDKDEWDF